jgi:hypothetical protein
MTQAAPEKSPTVPEGPYGKLPYIYLAYLTAGLLWFVLRRRRKETLAGTEIAAAANPPP